MGKMQIRLEQARHRLSLDHALVKLDIQSLMGLRSPEHALSAPRLVLLALLKDPEPLATVSYFYLRGTSGGTSSLLDNALHAALPPSALRLGCPLCPLPVGCALSDRSAHQHFLRLACQTHIDHGSLRDSSVVKLSPSPACPPSALRVGRSLCLVPFSCDFSRPGRSYHRGDFPVSDTRMP